ncbi:MAG: PulJ/GspJ family protein [Candidatus Loosdrechtia sp.]|uniref:PulJ/GspJ family protein n=1 Tax=Candidatus Loosdrechtia sp. TaxID=3101272 RepID=UPI003A5EB378|nr:MAG: prepilin-type N-terminal cleavage/methylation domain-containing protein [Candidatus Jettenia sp. AMX2]
MGKKQDGFTLLELLIVIALMAILWGVAYTMFYQSGKVFSFSRNKLEKYQYARMAMDGISRDLKGATLKDTTDYFKSFTKAEAAGLTPTPRDNSSILTFLSLTPNGSSTPVTLVTYYVNDADELMRAEYNDVSYIYGTVTGFNPADAVFYKLASNIDYFNLSFIYIYKNSGVSEVRVRNDWDSTNGDTAGRLPQAVKVVLQIYGIGTGNVLETGTFTAKIKLP